MQVIDQNLSAQKRAEIYTPLNGLLMAALLMAIFGEHFLPALYNGMYQTAEPISEWLNLSVRVICMGIGAVLADALGRRREVALVGLGLYILLAIAAMATKSLNGYPLFILAHLAMGCATMPLTSALVQHTGFMGRIQKTVLMSLIAVYLFNSIFSMIAFRIMEGNDKEMSLTVMGVVLLVAALVLVIADLTQRPTPAGNMAWDEAPTGENAPAWPEFIAVFGLLVLATGYLSYMTSRAFDANMWFGRPENMITLKFFFSIFFAGIMALMFFVFDVRNHWVYILTGGVLTLIMILVGLWLGKSQPLQADEGKTLGMLFSFTSALGYKFLFYGFMIWIYRYAGLRFFTCILFMYEFFQNIAAKLAHEYPFIDMQVIFDYTNF